MRYYSTNNPSLKVDLKQAVTQGLAPDNGLYMPEQIPALPREFFDSLNKKTFKDIAFSVARQFTGNDIPENELRRIIEHTITFDAPLVEVESNILALELFHGPTLAFKDFGARFMSQMLGYFAQQQDQEITILVATSGDTGSAVANGFLDVPGTRVIVLYPGGKVSEIQEKQFTTLGKNITALEIEGTFDDCQGLVKQAFLDEALRVKYFLTSANSINIARLIPQSFYYFNAVAQLKDRDTKVIFSVPSGNFGNLTGGLLAKRMGLPVDKFIASTNVNDVVPEYLQTQSFVPRPSLQTISNAMDVGNPSNFVRMLDLYGKNFNALREDVVGYAFNDEETRSAMRSVYGQKEYVMDPHGAIGYLGLKKYMAKTRFGGACIFMETAHPAKFKEVVDQILPHEVPIPEPLKKFMEKPKETVKMKAHYEDFRDYLVRNL